VATLPSLSVVFVIPAAPEDELLPSEDELLPDAVEAHAAVIRLTIPSATPTHRDLRLCGPVTLMLTFSLETPHLGECCPVTSTLTQLTRCLSGS
jgi:hypothetical protein